MMIQIQLNGAAHEIAAQSHLQDLLVQLDLENQRLAIEVNEALVPRSQFTEYTLQAGDTVEIVRAIGGG